jgi:hypothetical protein
MKLVSFALGFLVAYAWLDYLLGGPTQVRSLRRRFHWRVPEPVVREWPVFRGPILREDVDDIYGGVVPEGRTVVEP